MKGLILKDISVITKHLKIFLLLIVFISLSSGGSLAFFAFFYGGMLPSTAFSYDERSKWNDLAIMFPIKKSDIVLSKYIFGYIGIALCGVLIAVGTILGPIVLKTESALSLNMFVLALSSTLYFIAINLFLNFKLGVEKSRVFLIIMLIAISYFGTTLITGNTLFTMDILPDLMATSISPTSLIILGGAIIANIISIKLSIFIFENK